MYYFWLGEDAEKVQDSGPKSVEDREEKYLRNQHEDEYRGTSK